MMRALVLESARPVEQNPLVVKELPLPEPAPRQVRVRVSACGVCRTDLHIVEGELSLPRLPLVPGHQIVGVVEARGASADQFREGDRIGIPWLNHTCGRCRFCAREQENLCEQAQFTGYHADGGYAEYTVVDEEFAYPIPAAFSDTAAAPLLCAGIIGYRALRLSEVRPGERLGLYGFGGSAHIAIQVARHWGCEILVFTRNTHHQDLARRLGAAWTGQSEDDPPGQLDAAIIFAPVGILVPTALRHLRKGGVVALAGIYMSPIPSLEYATVYHEKTIRSVANSTRQDARELLQLAEDVPIQTETETFPLAAANQALLHLKQSEIRGAAVLKVSDPAQA